MITKVAFISHPTRDMTAAKKFYGKLLGLKAGSSYEDKWCEFDTPDGKSIAMDSFSPVENGPFLALETDNIEKDVARLRKSGVPVLMDVMDNKVCKMAIVQDPSGHSIMLHQMEASRLAALNASRAQAQAKAQTAAKPKAAAKPSAAPKVAAKPAAKSGVKPSPKAARPAKTKSRR